MERALIPMIQTSLRAPRTAADLIIAMNLSRETLWTALALVAVANTFLVYGMMQLSGPVLQMPGYFERPLVLFVINAGLMVVYIHAMYWSGLAIGGQGELMDVLAVVVWFHVLWLLAQAATILAAVIIPGLASYVSLGVAIWGIWIFLNFLAAALNLKSPWHGIVVLLVAFVALVLGLGTVMALIGGLAQGVVS